MRELGGVVVALLVVACGDDAAPMDSSVPDAVVDSGAPVVAPPDVPWVDRGSAVVMTPCLEGWREVTGGTTVECDPYPVGGASTCARGDAHFPAEGACRPIGEACPSGEFADGLPPSGVVFVSASASAGGDGSRSAPYDSLAQVPWTSLVAGTTVALAGGSYDGTLPLRAGVSVVGACAQDTTLTGVAAPVAAVVTVTNAGEPALLRNLSITDAPQPGVRVDGGRSLALEGVHIVRARTAGALASGSGAELRLTDVVIEETQPDSTMRFGRGIGVEAGGRVEAERTLISRNHDAGVFVFGSGAEAQLTNVVIRDTQPQLADRESGLGVQVGPGGRCEAAGLLVEGSHFIGVFVAGDGAEASISDSIVRDTRAHGVDDSNGRGVWAEAGARLEVSRVLVANNLDLGLSAFDEGTTVTLTDVLVRDTQPRVSDERFGRGINVQDGASLTGARVGVVGNHDDGVQVEHDTTVVDLSDLSIADTRAERVDGTSGRGLNVQNGATVTVLRALVRENRDIGVLALGVGTRVYLSDVIVQDVMPMEASGSWGRGIHAQDGATVVGTRLRVDVTREVGITSATSAIVEITDTLVTNVDYPACFESDCTDRGFAHGIGAVAGTVVADRFEVRGASLCGVMVSPNILVHSSSIDLRSGVVSGSDIGACILLDGYDVGRLSDGVVYRDNATNLETARSLPVPDIVDE